MRTERLSRRTGRVLLSLAASLLAAACATTAPSRAPFVGRDVLRATDVPANVQPASALELLQLVRPEYLKNRARSTRLFAPTEPVVYLNGHRLAELSMLRHVSSRTLVEVRYLRGLNAIARYGLDHEGGALLVTTSGLP